MSPEEVKKFEEENMTDTQREMSEEKARKFEQREQMPPILIIYRDNDLFEKYVPGIERMLVAQGRRVEVKNFLRGTEQNEIKEWYEENLERLDGMEIISDRTAKMPWKMEDKFNTFNIKSIGELDSVLSGAMSRIFLSEESRSKLSKSMMFRDGVINPNAIREPEENVKEFFTSLVKHILVTPENIPDKVIIFPDRLVDHMSDYDGGRSYDEMKKLNAGSEFERKIAEVEKMLIEKIKGWLVDGGLNPDKIEIGDNVYSLEKYDKPNNWIIMDRHIDGVKEDVVAAKFLQMPTSNFYNTVKENKLLDYSEEELKHALKNYLEEKF